MKQIVIVLVILAIHSAQVSGIYRGNEANAGEFPFMAALFVRDATSLEDNLCGGFIIDQLNIVTSAGCLKNALRDHEHSLIVGCNNLLTRSGCREIRFKNYVLHEFYNNQNSRENDIALVRLEQPLQFNNLTGKGAIRAIKLPHVKDTSAWKADNPYWISGWGHTGIHESGRLLKGITRSVELRNCTMRWVNSKNFSEEIRWAVDLLRCCAGGTKFGQEPRSGDQGGPLFRLLEGGHEVVGVISYGYEKCPNVELLPFVYTHVGHYLFWINEAKKKAVIPESMDTSMNGAHQNPPVLSSTQGKNTGCPK